MVGCQPAGGHYLPELRPTGDGGNHDMAPMGAGCGFRGRRPDSEMTPPDAVNGRGTRRASTAADLTSPAAWRRRAAQLLASAYRDELTGALTRRAGKEYLADEVQRAQRTGTSLAVAFVDVDGLKATNDTLGHAAGDALLVAVVKALSGSLRSYDRVIRYGGDEFVCVLPAGDADAVARGVDRARDLLTAAHSGASFSSGVAALQPGETADGLVRRADEALYAARRDAARLATAAAESAAPPHVRAGTDAGAYLGCGHCGGRIPLGDFVLHDDPYATRSADCAMCGETTLVRLSAPIAFNGLS